MSRYIYPGIIPHGYCFIDKLWSKIQNDIIYDVIITAVSSICLDIPDFEPKWSDIPKEKIDEWHDIVFHYDIRLWKPYIDKLGLPNAPYIIEYFFQHRLCVLCTTIKHFFMEKFNIKVVNGKYARNLDEENNVKPERKEINEKIE